MVQNFLTGLRNCFKQQKENQLIVTEKNNEPNQKLTKIVVAGSVFNKNAKMVSKTLNKNALKSGKSHLLGDSIRNEEAIISTQNRISSLKMFFTSCCIGSQVFFRNLLFMSYLTMTEYMCINTWKSIGQKLHHCHRAKTWWTWHVISFIAENKPRTHHKTHVHTMKVYKPCSVYSLTIEVFTEVFTCSCHFNVIFTDHENFFKPYLSLQWTYKCS